MILRGVIGPNTTHSEAEMAANLHISRTPVRSALAILAKEGIIETLPQVGFRVRLLSEEETQEIFVLRAALETVVVTGLLKKLAVSNSGNALIQPLIKNIQECERLARETDSTLENDYQFLESAHEFHIVMAHLAGYHQAADLFQTFRQKLRLVGTSVVKPVSKKRDVIQEHTAILTAIQDGDETKASGLMLHHLQASDDRFKEAIGTLTGV